MSSLFSQFPADKAPATLTINTLLLEEGTSPVSVFNVMADKPWSMWLDSCQSDHVDSRFDILVWQPDITVTTRAEQTYIRYFTQEQQAQDNAPKSNIAPHFPVENYQCCGEEQSLEDPLRLITELQKSVLSPCAPSQTPLPFLGGALGYFSYDLGRRFEKIPQQAEQDINLPDMAVGIYSQAIIFDSHTQQFYLLCQEDKRAEIELALSQQLQLINQPIIHSKVKADKFQLTSAWQPNMDKASYLDKFNQVQAYLRSGDCYQINLAQRFSAQYHGNEFEAYLALRAENKAPFSAFIRLESATILSVSPERFIQLHQGKVQTKPIKGTMPRSPDTVQDKKNAKTLAGSAKDRSENLMIVDLLRNDISKTCQAGSVKVPKLFDIESFPAVHHLVSTIEGQLQNDKCATDLLRAAFPGGSITGAPKIRAMEIIEELEPHRRSVYCGSIGYISACGAMDTSITIRTLICQKENEQGIIHCWAGGGLVADSTVESEYQETFDKVNKILPILSQLNAE